MFSSRFHWDLRTNRITRMFQEKRSGGARILDLTQSNPTEAGLAYPPEIPGAFADDRILRYEPAPAGSPAARRAIADYLLSRGRPADPARILLTASTSEAYSYLFKLLANPGDQFLVPRPSYPLFEFLADMEGVEIVHYRLAYHGQWSIDLDALVSAISERTRGIVVVNPNNPTGSFIKRAELAFLSRLAGERGIALISDEVFSDYSFGPDTDRVETLAAVNDCLAFSMSGLSKVAGLPQMKLGWIVTSGPEPLRAEALERLEWIADTYLSVSTPVQCAAAELLRAGNVVQRQIATRTSANLAFARDTLAGSAASILSVEGGWYMTLQVPRVRTEEEWVLELLNARDVLVQPGFFYDFESEAFLVVSLLSEPGAFHEGLKRISEFV